MRNTPLRLLAVALGSAFVLMGCNTAPTSSNTTSSASSSSSSSAANSSSSSSAAAPAQQGNTSSAASNEKESREAQVVGKPAPGSKFNKVQIGMGMKEVMDLIGQPTDQGAYVTGKAFIPFYYGRDVYRHELIYKGQGRLIFSGGAFGNYSSGRLSRIIHNADERGYR